jgi:hypothetical protein
MDCFSSIFFPSFQDFYTIVLDELVLEVVARHRDDILAQPVVDLPSLQNRCTKL